MTILHQKRSILSSTAVRVRGVTEAADDFLAEAGVDFLAEDVDNCWPSRRNAIFDWRKLLAVATPGEDGSRMALSFAEFMNTLDPTGCVAEIEAKVTLGLSRAWLGFAPAPSGWVVRPSFAIADCATT